MSRYQGKIQDFMSTSVLCRTWNLGRKQEVAKRLYNKQWLVAVIAVVEGPDETPDFQSPFVLFLH